MKRRSASVTLEALLVIPLLVIVTVAMAQFFITALVQQAAVNASIEGAKVASLQSSDMDDVRDAVNRVLDAVNLTVGPEVSVVRQTPFGTAMRGAYPCTPPATPALAINEVRVTVCIDMTANPLLNSLSAFGINVSGKTMTASTQTFFE